MDVLRGQYGVARKTGTPRERDSLVKNRGDEGEKLELSPVRSKHV
jgi:hypothetical protein